MKRENIKFRCSVYEKKLLAMRAKRAGISLSEYCRSSALGNEIVERLTQEQTEQFRMLTRYGNNFTRIGNMFRKHDPRLAMEADKLMDEIRKQLLNFKK